MSEATKRCDAGSTVHPRMTAALLEISRHSESWLAQRLSAGLNRLATAPGRIHEVFGPLGCEKISETSAKIYLLRWTLNGMTSFRLSPEDIFRSLKEAQRSKDATRAVAASLILADLNERGFAAETTREPHEQK